MKRVRKLLRWAVYAFAALLLIVCLSEWTIRTRTNDRLYADVSTVPHNRVALVLGTAAESRGGGPNQYFVNRMQAAAELYHSGKVDHLLLSGDNEHWGYNEPMGMRKFLIAAGVDSADMTLDFAGFDTFDSVVRAKKVFGLRKFTIVSQRFHNERALYIAQANDIDAIAFDAPDVPRRRTQWSWIRERGARLKMWLDLALGVDPHFLGEPVIIGQQVLPPADPRDH